MVDREFRVFFLFFVCFCFNFPKTRRRFLCSKNVFLNPCHEHNMKNLETRMLRDTLDRVANDIIFHLCLSVA